MYYVPLVSLYVCILSHNQNLVDFVFLSYSCVFCKSKCPKNENVCLMTWKKNEIIQHLQKGINVLYLK